LLRVAFDRSGIPFQVAGETTLYDLPESKALLDYLHFAGDNSKNIHLARILLRENCGIGEATLADLLRQAKGIGETLWNTLTNTTQIRRTPSLKALIAWLIHLKDAAENQLVVDLVDMVVKRLPEVTERTGTLAPRIRLRASQFDRNLQAFLDSTALANASDEYDPRADWVSLMTLHAAKGLEFDVVFITGCEESLLPYNTRGKNYDIDEERRLFYVGMTRAKQKLLLTRAMKRLLFGEYMNNRESRFVASIKDILKEIKAAEFRKTIESKIPADRQMDLF
jgi:DNA helicase-2/ATP-dependent DNA helicase PcrA